jgi:hypothetical protein
MAERGGVRGGEVQKVQEVQKVPGVQEVQWFKV